MRRGEGWPTHYPLLLARAIAAEVVTAWTMGPPGVRDLLARMARWRVPIRWWLAALSAVAFPGDRADRDGRPYAGDPFE